MPFWIQKGHVSNVLKLLVATTLDYVKEFVESCNVCACAKNLCHHPHGLLQLLSIPSISWFSISMDFITDLPPSSSYDFILVAVDHLTKMVHFI
jgi:hypothetical protein